MPYEDPRIRETCPRDHMRSNDIYSNIPILEIDDILRTYLIESMREHVGIQKTLDDMRLTPREEAALDRIIDELSTAGIRSITTHELQKAVAESEDEQSPVFRDFLRRAQNETIPLNTFHDPLNPNGKSTSVDSLSALNSHGKVLKRGAIAASTEIAKVKTDFGLSFIKQEAFGLLFRATEPSNSKIGSIVTFSPLSQDETQKGAYNLEYIISSSDEIALTCIILRLLLPILEDSEFRNIRFRVFFVSNTASVMAPINKETLESMKLKEQMVRNEEGRDLCADDLIDFFQMASGNTTFERKILDPSKSRMAF